MIADKLLDLNIYEMRYFAVLAKEKLQKTSGINRMKLNLDWPSVKKDGKRLFSIKICFRDRSMAPC